MEEKVVIDNKIKQNTSKLKYIQLAQIYSSTFGLVQPTLQYLQKYFQFTYTTKSTFKQGSQHCNGQAFYQTKEALMTRFISAKKGIQNIIFDGVVYGKRFQDYQVIIWKMKFASATNKWYVISTIYKGKFIRNQFLQHGFLGSTLTNSEDQWLSSQPLSNKKMWIQKVDKIFQHLHASGRLQSVPK